MELRKLEEIYDLLVSASLRAEDKEMKLIWIKKAEEIARKIDNFFYQH